MAFAVTRSPPDVLKVGEKQHTRATTIIEVQIQHSFITLFLLSNPSGKILHLTEMVKGKHNLILRN